MWAWAALPPAGACPGGSSSSPLRLCLAAAGEALPLYLAEEELRQLPPPQSSQGSLCRGNPLAMDRAQLTSPNSRRGDSTGEPPEQGSSGGRGPRWGSSSPASSTLPSRHSPLAFTPSRYMPSFPVTTPTRPR